MNHHREALDQALLRGNETVILREACEAQIRDLEVKVADLEHAQRKWQREATSWLELPELESLEFVTSVEGMNRWMVR